jgi:hypothetical protein
VFDLFTTIDLFVHELGGIERCARFIEVGKELERTLQPRGTYIEPLGIFLALPDGWQRGPKAAAYVIYPAVLLGWAALGLYGVKQ